MNSDAFWGIRYHLLFSLPFLSPSRFPRGDIQSSEVVKYLFPIDIEFAEKCQYLSFIDNSYMAIILMFFFPKYSSSFPIRCVRINCLEALYLASVLLRLSYEAFWKNFRERHVPFSCGKQCSHQAKRYKIALDMLIFDVYNILIF